MECNEVRSQLQAYLDQALTDEAARTLEAHLHECAGCWQELIALQDLFGELDDPRLQDMVLNEPAPLPDDFTATIMSRIEAEKPRGFSLLLPWLRRKWSSRQYASVAYAMGATAVIISTGNMLYIWNQATDRVAVWSAQASAYSDAVAASLGGAAVYVESLWHALMVVLHIG